MSVHLPPRAIQVGGWILRLTIVRCIVAAAQSGRFKILLEQKSLHAAIRAKAIDESPGKSTKPHVCSQLFC